MFTIDRIADAIPRVDRIATRMLFWLMPNILPQARRGYMRGAKHFSFGAALPTRPFRLGVGFEVVRRRENFSHLPPAIDGADVDLEFFR